MGLLLPVTAALAAPLRRANQRTEGFLMSHGVGAGRDTEIRVNP